MNFNKKNWLFLLIFLTTIGFVFLFVKQYLLPNPFKLKSKLTEYNIQYQPSFQYLLKFNKYLRNVKNIDINLEEWVDDSGKFYFFVQEKNSKYAYTYRYNPNTKVLSLTIGLIKQSINEEVLNRTLNNIITALIIQIKESPTQEITTLDKISNRRHSELVDSMVNEIEPGKYKNVNFK